MLCELRIAFAELNWNDNKWNLVLHATSQKIDRLVREGSHFTVKETTNPPLKLQSTARDTTQGILNDVLILLNNIICEMNGNERECILSFDEMKLSKTLEYDPSADEVLGPHNKFLDRKGLWQEGFLKPGNNQSLLDSINRWQKIFPTKLSDGYIIHIYKSRGYSKR